VALGFLVILTVVGCPMMPLQVICYAGLYIGLLFK